MMMYLSVGLTIRALSQWRNQLFALGPPTCYLVSADLGPLHLDRCNSDQWALEKQAAGFEPLTSLRFGSGTT